jgi:hypothetical protein
MWNFYLSGYWQHFFPKRLWLQRDTAPWLLHLPAQGLLHHLADYSHYSLGNQFAWQTRWLPSATSQRWVELFQDADSWSEPLNKFLSHPARCPEGLSLDLVHSEKTNPAWLAKHLVAPPASRPPMAILGVEGWTGYILSIQQTPTPLVNLWGRGWWQPAYELLF